jgi:hypothetical protein
MKRSIFKSSQLDSRSLAIGAITTIVLIVGSYATHFLIQIVHYFESGGNFGGLGAGAEAGPDYQQLNLDRWLAGATVLSVGIGVATYFGFKARRGRRRREERH